MLVEHRYHVIDESLEEWLAKTVRDLVGEFPSLVFA